MKEGRFEGRKERSKEGRFEGRKKRSKEGRFEGRKVGLKEDLRLRGRARVLGHPLIFP